MDYPKHSSSNSSSEFNKKTGRPYSNNSGRHSQKSFSSQSKSARHELMKSAKVLESLSKSQSRTQSHENPEHQDDAPDGGFRAWLVVFGCFCGMFSTFGLINCVGVFLTYYSQGPLASYPLGTISWITSAQVFCNFSASLVYGSLYDRYGPRWLLIIGTIVYVFSLMMLSLSTEYYQIFLAQGILTGTSGSAIFNAMILALPMWFKKNRGTAFGITASGSSFGGVVLPIFLNQVGPRIGFPWAVRCIAFLFLFLLTITCMTVKSRLPVQPRPIICSEYLTGFKEPVYSLTVTAGCFFLLAMFLPFNYIVLQAQQQGVSVQLAQYLLPIINAVSIFGRIVPGIVADKIGRYNTIIIIACSCTIVTLAIWIPGKSLGSILAFAIIFGFTSGGFISLFAVLISQISDIRHLGQRTGSAAAVQGLAALIGSPIGGAITAAQHGQYLGLQLFCGAAMAVSTLLYFLARWVQVGAGIKIVKV